MGILLSFDVTDLTFDLIIKALAVFIVVWFIVKNFLDVRKTAKEQIVREQSWDKAASVIAEKEKVWDDGLADVRGERKQLMDRYDDRLDRIEKRIDENHTDTEAKIQNLQAMLVMVIKSVNAILEGQIEQGSDGEVKKMHTELNYFIAEQIGK